MNYRKDAMKTEDRMQGVGIRILSSARDELYLKMRFLDVALSSFDYVLDGGIQTLRTDGFAIYYNPRYLGGMFRANRIKVNRAYMHMLLHCIFHHLSRKGSREEFLYNLSCDIAVESVIDGLYVRSVRLPSSWLRKETIRKISEKYKVLSAGNVYRYLEQEELSERELTRLAMEFIVDDHSQWNQEDSPKGQGSPDQKWQDISDKTETDLETFSNEASEGSRDLVEQLRVENRERYDYRRFLKKFSVLREEMQVDTDSFDYGFYSYGLRLYGNMPLLEPQEWKEVQKVEEFAIVIDTSMSCSDELVKKFLEETYSILLEEESFFRKVNIHIIQCDEKVQSDKKITNEKELKEYMEQLELIGRGGTDFRPAFTYIDRLIREKAFERLKGVLYFTDGLGTFPAKMPPYETAFIFMQEQYEEVQVPSWAIKLILEEDDIKGDSHEYKTGKTGN